MDEFRIRPAVASDAEQIGAVGYAAWLKGIGVHVGPEAHARIDVGTFASFAQSHASQIIVAEIADSVVGFAATEHGDNYISDLWVSPGHEGRGIGSALIASSEAAIAARGYDLVTIEVFTANERARSLYRRHGYEPIWQGMQEDGTLRIEMHKTVLAKAL